MLSFIKCFERVLIKIISDLFPDNKLFIYNVEKFIKNQPLFVQSLNKYFL